MEILRYSYKDSFLLEVMEKFEEWSKRSLNGLEVFIDKTLPQGVGGEQFGKIILLNENVITMPDWAKMFIMAHEFWHFLQRQDGKIPKERNQKENYVYEQDPVEGEAYCMAWKFLCNILLKRGE